MDSLTITQQIVHLATVEFWSLVLLLAVVAAVGFWTVFRYFRRIRLIEDTPTSKIRSAHQGYVELSGYSDLMKGEPIIAPLSGKRCTWYSYKVEKKTDYIDARGHRRKGWKTVQSGSSEDLFLLIDDTGECVIDPEGAVVMPSQSEIWYGDSPAGSYGLPGTTSWWGGLFASGNYRYTEKRILPADPLYALGTFRTVGGARDLPDTREEITHLLHLWKRDRPQLLARFDKNSDGEIDLKEWETARKTAYQEVLQKRAELAVAPGIHMMSKPDDSGQHYLISTAAPEDMVKVMRLYMAAALLAFFGGGGMVVWLLNIRLIT